jgi:hypothetical protein
LGSNDAGKPIFTKLTCANLAAPKKAKIAQSLLFVLMLCQPETKLCVSYNWRRGSPKKRYNEDCFN